MHKLYDKRDWDVEIWRNIINIGWVKREEGVYLVKKKSRNTETLIKGMHKARKRQELLSETYRIKVIDWYRSLEMASRKVQESEKKKYEMEHGQTSKECK